MFKSKIKVYGYHLDAYGHVNHARYLEFFESARWELMASRMDLRELDTLGVAFVIANININYRKPAFLGQVMEVQTALVNIGGKSARFRQQIFIAGNETLITEMELTFVLIDKTTTKILPIEGRIREILEEFLD